MCEVLAQRMSEVKPINYIGHKKLPLKNLYTCVYIRLEPWENWLSSAEGATAPGNSQATGPWSQ